MHRGRLPAANSGNEGNPAAGATIQPGYEYAHRQDLFDITAGTNDPLEAGACGYDYLCMARTGFDAPTGLGSPDGTSAF